MDETPNTPTVEEVSILNTPTVKEMSMPNAPFVFVAEDGTVLGDADARAEVWLDVNCNGSKDKSDIPFEDVCVYADTCSKCDEQLILNSCSDDRSYDVHTDEDGTWPKVESVDFVFFAGATCDDVYVQVIVPEGYKPVTPRVVNDCWASFGLASISVCQDKSSP